MEAKTVISIESARKILREFNAPIGLMEEREVIDIINRIDAIAYLYITGLRERLEPSDTYSAEGSVSHLTEVK